MITALVGVNALIVGLAAGIGLGMWLRSDRSDRDEPIIAPRESRTSIPEARVYVAPSRYTSAPIGAHAPPTAESDPAE